MMFMNNAPKITAETAMLIFVAVLIVFLLGRLKNDKLDTAIIAMSFVAAIVVAIYQNY